MKHSGKHANVSSQYEHMIIDLKRRFFISLFLTIPILLLSDTIQTLFNFKLQFAGAQYLLLFLSTIIYLYGGKPFLQGLVDEMRQKQPGMMTLVGIAITVAYIYSTAIVFGLKGQPFFWELATLVDIMLLGHWIEMRSVRGASQALQSLTELMPSIAHLLKKDGSTKDIPSKEVAKGDHVVVRPGEKVPADGEVIDGESEVNEAALTGESTPVFKTQGDQVIAGSINGSGSLTVLVTKDQQENYIAQIVKLINEVMQSKSRAQDLADTTAFVLTIVALVVSMITFIVWLTISGAPAFSLERMVSVIVIACPHALGLAIPLVIAIITSIAARNGLLIRNRKAFEEAVKLDVVLFDKTGTLTHGVFQVTDVITLGKESKEQILGLLAATSHFAKHPIVSAAVAKAEAESIPLPKLTKGITIAGKGTKSVLDGMPLFTGNRKLMDTIDFMGSDVKASVTKAERLAGDLMKQGKTITFIATPERIEGVIAAADTIRPESYIACKRLKEKGVHVVMITGDNAFNAQAVAKELGIDQFFAEVLPDEKADKVGQLRKRDFIVAMVGDGINDAPALAAANIGIAIGAGTDVAIETADIILVKNDPQKVVDLIELSELSRRKILQNIGWATAYNIVALPLAAGILYQWGILIDPAFAAVFMTLSTVIVAINSRFISYNS